jgi:hypothetical protein
MDMDMGIDMEIDMEMDTEKDRDEHGHGYGHWKYAKYASQVNYLHGLNSISSSMSRKK